jgi:FkbM family methyltransferase
MGKIINQATRKLGFEIVKYPKSQKLQNPPKIKSVRTNALSFHKTKTGNYYLPADAVLDEIAHAMKIDLIYDSNVYEVAKKYIIPGTTALDLGSNFGQMAILMSKLAGEKGMVHAFEADDFVFEILKKNIEENSTNVVAHFGAVHDKGNETLYFPVQDFDKFGTYGSYGIDYIHGQGRPVQTIAIDKIEYELPVSFMKIDIEGGELFALKGSVNTINKYRMPIIFEYGSYYEDELGLSFQDYIDFVQKINYKFERIIDNINYLIVPKR